MESSHTSDSETSSIRPLNTDELLKIGSKQVVCLLVPVSLCMAFVVLVASNVDYYTKTDVYWIYTPFYTPGAGLGRMTWETLANVLIIMTFVVVMTCVLVALFKFHCYKVIRGWLILSTFILLFMITAIFFTVVIRSANLFIDYILFALLIWNFGAVGMMAIHWRTPLRLQQAYLIFVSAQFALIFLKYLPKWTCWAILGALAIWDLIAVLCPRGPLRILVELSQERQEPILPALLYSTMMAYMEPDQQPSGEEQRSASSPLLTNRSPPTPAPDPNDEPPRVPLPTPSEASADHPQNIEELRDREGRGVKLGLGDFIFYSVLIGRATVDGDAVTIIACFLAILVGMCFTIIALGVANRALPALPVSIAFGILFYFLSSIVLSPFLEALSASRLFF